MNTGRSFVYLCSGLAPSCVMNIATQHNAGKERMFYELQSCLAR